MKWYDMHISNIQRLTTLLPRPAPAAGVCPRCFEPGAPGAMVAMAAMKNEITYASKFESSFPPISTVWYWFYLIQFHHSCSVGHFSPSFPMSETSVVSFRTTSPGSRTTFSQSHVQATSCSELHSRGTWMAHQLTKKEGWGIYGWNIWADLSGTYNNTIHYNTIQSNTIQYNTIQHNTIQYNTNTYIRVNSYGRIITVECMETYGVHNGFTCSIMCFDIWPAKVGCDI